MRVGYPACYASPVFAKVLGSIFRFLPGGFRRGLVRLGQRRFTVTAGAFVFDEQGRILLLEHEFRPDSRWGIPGGFLNQSEQPEEALRRELREEVALEVDDVQLLFARTLARPRQVEIHFACTTKGNPTPSSFEIRKAGWFAPDALPDDLSRDQRRMIKRAIDVREKRRE
ncbi:MAG TPA: NUDIX domain-containing protein [Pyrinomonadaceae bacterium]